MLSPRVGAQLTTLQRGYIIKECKGTVYRSKSWQQVVSIPRELLAHLTADCQSQPPLGMGA